MTSTDVGMGPGEPRPEGRTEDRSPKDIAASAVQGVKQEAASFAASAQGMAAEKVEQQKRTAAETMTQFASAIRTAGDELARNDQSMAGRMVKQAADGLEGFTRSVADKRPEELLDAVREFGRRNPAAFVAGSVLMGVALGRFIRSSQHHTMRGEGVAHVPSEDYGARPQDGSVEDLTLRPDERMGEVDVAAGGPTYPPGSRFNPEV